MTEATIRRDWLAKSLAGTLLGLTLGLAAGGLCMRHVDGAPALKAQLAMWVVPPVWMGVLSLVFLFRNGWRAWAWLLAANALAWGALLAFPSLPT